MLASNVSLATLEYAAHAVGVRADISPVSGSGRRFRVKLYPAVTPDMLSPSGRRYRGARGDARYQREAVGCDIEGRRVCHRIHAVCWHGFRDFFRAVFAQESDAVFRTALDTWRGVEDFEKRFAATGYQTIGPHIASAAIASACRCPDKGIAG